MAKAYWVAHVRVHQPEPYALYSAAATDAFTRHGGRILTRGGTVVGLEGEVRARNVIIEFDSMDAAVACYESAEYQAAKVHRAGAADIDLMLIEATSPSTHVSNT